MAAGMVSSSATAVGIAAGNGLFGYERRADARFSLTAQADEEPAGARLLIGRSIT